LKVALDTRKGQEPKLVSFAVGVDGRAAEFNSFKHGYAGTIYRGQGRTLDDVFVAHSAHWRSSAAYVALTRHRENVHIFAARETVADVDALARPMARTDGKRAATAYHVEAADLIRVHKALEAAEEGRSTSATRTAGIEAGAGIVSEFVANYAERTIEALATGLEGLLGGSSGPTGQQPAAREMTAKERREARLAAFQKSEQVKRKAALEKLKKEFGGDIAQEKADEIARSRDRDRGGGQSL
jgi:hypothetical protein